MKLAFAFVLCFWCLLSYSATYTAASCDYSDVYNALALCSNGDTVVIPTGDCIWTNGLSITKGITLIGAGQDQTILRDWKPSTFPQFIAVANTHTNFVRISGMTIYGGSNSYSTINIGDSNDKTNVFRVDHITITNMQYRGVYPVGWSIGVIDHCKFFARSAEVAPTAISISGEGDYSWDTRPPSFGSTNMVVIEDNTFSWYANANGAVDSYTGARWAFRYNWVTNVNVGNHGTDSTGTRSTHSFEVYNNYWTNSTAGNMIMFAFRGGTGVFFSNRLESHYIYPAIGLANYRASGTNIYGGTTPCCNPISGTNWMDGNVDEYGWPPYDSIGRTSPTVYHTNELAPNGVATAYTVQGSSPVYQWSNTLRSHILGTTQMLACTVINNYTNVGEYAYIPSAINLIKANRDYFDNTPMPGYAPLQYPHPFIGASTPMVYYTPFRKP